MDETIIVDAIIETTTFVGKVNFPASIPEGLAGYFLIPDDVVDLADEMGLDHRDIKFILGATKGRWAMTVDLDVADIAPKLGYTFDEIDTIVRKLIDKGYAQMEKRFNLYRYWIVLLHCKGTRFDIR